jgi:diguanylate cyclase (GGDEF)-like protein
VPVAVLVADSTAEDAFGQESLKALGGITKTMSAMLLSLTEKYDLFSDAGLLKAEQRMQRRIVSDATIPMIVNVLAEEVAGLFPWDLMTVVLFDESRKQWTVANVRTRINEKYVAAKQIVDFHGSIVGAAIKQNSPQIVADLTSARQHRFFPDESAWGSPMQGTFMAVPLASSSKCFGAITLETRERSLFGAKEAEQIRHLGSVAATSFDASESREIIKEYVAVDETSGTYSKKFLSQRLEEELLRADDADVDLSFVLVSIAGFQDLCKRYGHNGETAAVERVAAVLRSYVRSYDIVGRYDAGTFGVVLVGTTSHEAFLWAEKVRATVASSIIAFDQKNFSVTITAGICGASEGMSRDECFSFAEQVLQKAVEAGGNMVRVL